MFIGHINSKRLSILTYLNTLDSWFAVTVLCYLALILLASLILPRIQGRFTTERGILQMHVSSFVCFAAGLFFYFYFEPSEERAAEAVGALAAHVILSISFLEVWSLTEGGYSLQIIQAIHKQALERKVLIDKFTNLGNQKREDRLSSLKQMGLICENGDLIELTPRGRIVAQFISGMLAFINVKDNA
tara:strand:- start:491 stop:1054 length:564 start_codon:yes stop_codon:yes gene_type:complete